MMSVDETLMCSFQILKPAEKKSGPKYPPPPPPRLRPIRCPQALLRNAVLQAAYSWHVPVCLPRHYCRTTVHTAPEEALGACMHAHDVRTQRAVRSAQKKP
jgi:hypothetical protein